MSHIIIKYSMSIKLHIYGLGYKKMWIFSCFMQGIEKVLWCRTAENVK